MVSDILCTSINWCLMYYSIVLQRLLAIFEEMMKQTSSIRNERPFSVPVGIVAKVHHNL